ncbi:class I SAM-dependent methyltransferase [Salinibacter ruber]|uniref:class I SAM-dependent methyltransferase n=1 Tax=Salinibacter ruber TaxID=146919 RepID=UPI00161D12D1|nr:SAM-dependent methyltransferase [Salinibacter ruber]MBB4059633.1 ribosomal protein L11 methylase PrmA [Salinibacter ruber]
METSRVAGSFRDPSGFLFRRGGTLYRQVNSVYREDYDRLMESGLYNELVGSGLLVAHEEVDIDPAGPDAYRIIRPELVPFISYPYEWSFSQLQDAALLTLEIQKRALEADQSLKDASAYNVQFRQGRPVFIDSLSFEEYEEGSPWIAYGQFCRHFLAPLALMSYTDVRLGQLFRTHLDGVPLDLASTLLPARSYLSFSLLSHIHFHAKGQDRYADVSDEKEVPDREVGRTQLLGIIDNLQSAVSGLSWEPEGTEWAGYYDDTNYSSEGFDAKEAFVAEAVDTHGPEAVWDLGANTGRFSRIAAESGARTLALDIDPAAVEKGYRACRDNGQPNILPLVLDLTNPSPGIGWEHAERKSLMDRGPADMALALALVHHLAISNNVPLPRLAGFFSQLCETLVVEFVPKSDGQVQRLLVTREDIFDDYTQEHFEEAFREHFTIEETKDVPESKRTLYRMQVRSSTS